MERERFRERETPRLNPERVENIGNEILDSPEVMEYLISKINDKLRFKDAISQDDGSNDFSPWKRLGIFIVHEQRLPEDLVRILQRNGVDVYGDELLELHIPPQDAKSVKDVSNSFKRLGDYLRANRKERNIPRYVYGVSYLADLAKHWGFAVVDLPKGIQEKSGAANVLKNYAEALPDTKKAAIARRYATVDIKLCLMSTEDLIKRTDKE